MGAHETLTDLASLRGGCFTRHDALVAGWTPHHLRAALQEGEWSRLQRGVFVDRHWYGGLDPSARHLVDVRARLLARGPGWCVSRRSAALVHELPLLGQPPRVPLLTADRHAATDRGYRRTERLNTLPADERTERLGLPVTTLARTVVDIAREESFRSALVVADGALRQGLSWHELRDVADRCRLWPGGGNIRRVLALADGRAESPMESLSRAAFSWLGLPVPEPQVEIYAAGALVARVDFLWREQHVVGEADGRTKYSSVADLYAEKRREERLRDLGFEVVRWDWHSVNRVSDQFAAVIRRALARGATHQLAPGVTLRST